MPRLCHATTYITTNPERFIIEYDDRNWNPGDLIFAHHHDIRVPACKEAPPFFVPCPTFVPALSPAPSPTSDQSHLLIFGAAGHATTASKILGE